MCSGGCDMARLSFVDHFDMTRHYSVDERRDLHNHQLIVTIEYSQTGVDL